MTDYYCQAIGNFLNGRSWSWGIHVNSGQSEAALATTFSNAVVAAWSTNGNPIKSYLAAGTQLDYVTVATLNGTFHETSKTPVVTVVNGTAGGDTLPIQESVVVSERSNSIQKFGRGRFYLPALEETFVNNNVVDATALGHISTNINTIKTAIQADGSTIFVVSKKPHKDGTGQYVKSVITIWKVSNKPARQSKRNRKTAAVYV